MASLTTQQRNALESAVKLARKVSETGAYNALQAMAVDQPEPFPHMPPHERALRNNLRSKARLLGDKLDAKGVQQINKLAYELAYETWHKMLFAKFLEANNLLIHPDGVAVSFEDVEELAKDEGYADKWDAAAAYASKMLPAIFRPEDPLMQVPFSTNDRIKLEGIIDGLESSIFIADDALGWVYQFWQSEAKAVINASGDKIDGEKLPAVTQLFTEPYMVHFLIDNTLGAWWVSRNPGVKPPIKFEYLRTLPSPSGEGPGGEVAAGTFPGWPSKTAEVTALDPCMGSGHFVVSLFSVFVALRIYEENLSKSDAIDKVISENLFGLELDPRCTQLAAFNLALTAWKFNGEYKELPEMNLACSGIAPTGKKEDWVKLVGKVADPVEKARMENGMQLLYSHFQLAPELGSLLDPTTIRPDAFIASFDQLKPVLLQALAGEKDSDMLERGVIAAGIAKAGQLLAKKYTLQITNVPYLSRGKQDKILQDYCTKNYNEAKGELATVFLERMSNSCYKSGIACSVMPQDWLFKGIYKGLRTKLLKTKTWSFVARLGIKSFQTPMWDFNVLLISILNSIPSENSLFSLFDVSSELSAINKDNALKINKVNRINQLLSLRNPDSRIAIDELRETKLLSKYCEALVGLQTSDDPMFIICFWELKITNKLVWEYLQGSPVQKRIDSGMSYMVRWENGKGLLLSLSAARPTQGLKAVGKNGIAISRMGHIYPFFFAKQRLHQNVAVIVPFNVNNIKAIWAYCESNQYESDIKNIDQSLKVTNATLIKVPFDLDHWLKIANEKYPNGLPKPYSDDPTQWLFHGHPIKTDNPLQVSVARLLGYRWPAESDTEMELAEEARKLIADVKAFDHLSDEDGIVCIPSVNSEHAGADRLWEYLQTVFAGNWNNHTIAQLLQKEGSNSANLADWLRDEFFIQHCKVFQNRPFIWHIWDGRKDGFSALVNYHKLTKDNLSKLIYTYLGDWIRMCEAKKKSGESGAEGLLIAALKLKEKLELILKGEAPYDIFVRWKTLAQQPIGWEPDLNDGVRLNIRPFVEAGVLRSKFNIKWGIDRGKNPTGSHWGEIRDNDRHLSLEEKRSTKKI